MKYHPIYPNISLSYNLYPVFLIYYALIPLNSIKPHKTVNGQNKFVIENLCVISLGIFDFFFCIFLIQNVSCSFVPSSSFNAFRKCALESLNTCPASNVQYNYVQLYWVYGLRAYNLKTCKNRVIFGKILALLWKNGYK